MRWSLFWDRSSIASLSLGSFLSLTARALSPGAEQTLLFSSPSCQRRVLAPAVSRLSLYLYFFCFAIRFSSFFIDCGFQNHFLKPWKWVFRVCETLIFIKSPFSILIAILMKKSWKIGQKLIKIYEKCYSKFDSKFDWFFYRFLMDFDLQNEARILLRLYLWALDERI